MIYFKSNYSSKILAQMVVFAVVLVLILFLNFDMVWKFYFANQETMAGIVINGLILVLFLLGILSIAYTLLHYRHEETALDLFLTNLRQSPNNPALSVDTDSLIVQRYEAMVSLHKRQAEINQGALAATVVASESTRLSLPRYISNILILCGVFGTIVSLSIALMGASDLLESTGDISGMGSVIHGMSTALSTTTTAIISYLFFGYFYQKLTDIQTNLFSGLEQVCTIHLMPRFAIKSENVLSNIGHLVQALNDTALSMQNAQQNMLQMSQKASELISTHDARISGMAEDVHVLKSLLRQGFRLPEPESSSTDKRGLMNQGINKATGRAVQQQNESLSKQEALLKNGNLTQSNSSHSSSPRSSSSRSSSTNPLK